MRVFLYQCCHMVNTLLYEISIKQTKSNGESNYYWKMHLAKWKKL